MKGPSKKGVIVVGEIIGVWRIASCEVGGWRAGGASEVGVM